MVSSGGGGGGGDMGPTVEVDQTFAGGRERNKHSHKKLRAGRSAVGKQVVMGVIERGGKVVAGPAPSTDGPTLKSVIKHHGAPGSAIYTGNHVSYRGIQSYKHVAVNHGVGEFVRDQTHTNGIESFWALLKRGYYGVYHYMSSKHLNRYVNEFSFRHNTSHVDTIKFIGMTAARMVGHRLTYKALAHG